MLRRGAATDLMEQVGDALAAPRVVSVAGEKSMQWLPEKGGHVSRDSTSLVDVHRTIHQAEASVRALSRFSKATSVNECIASLNTYIGQLQSQSNSIRDAPQESNYLPEECNLAGAIDSNMNSGSSRISVAFLGRSMRASSSILEKVQRTLPDSQQVLPQRQRKARENRLLMFGSLPNEASYAFVWERRLIAKLAFLWQRQLYSMLLRKSHVPTIPNKRSNTNHPAFLSAILRFQGIILCAVYCLLATSFVFAFHLRQNSQRGRSQNAIVSVAAVANTVIEMVIVAPLLLVVRLAILPTITKLIL